MIEAQETTAPLATGAGRKGFWLQVWRNYRRNKAAMLGGFE